MESRCFLLSCSAHPTKLKREMKQSENKILEATASAFLMRNDFSWLNSVDVVFWLNCDRRQHFGFSYHLMNATKA